MKVPTINEIGSRERAGRQVIGIHMYVYKKLNRS